MSDTRGDYAILISLATREEAEVAAATLRADGIDAFTGNAVLANNHWLITQALGGVQVFVPGARLIEARDVLRERIRENADAWPEDRIARRDHWKAWLFGIVVYGAPLAAWLEYYWLSQSRIDPLNVVSGVLYAPDIWFAPIFR